MLVSVKAGREGRDEELLLALAAGDDSALGPLYRRYVPTVFKMKPSHGMSSHRSGASLCILRTHTK